MIHTRLILGVCWLWCGVVTATDVQVTDMFPTNTARQISGICFHGGMLYAITNENELLRYDPVTGKQVQLADPLIPNLAFPHTHGMTLGSADTFWIAEVNAAFRFYQVTFSDLSIVSTLTTPPGGPAYGVAFDKELLWVGHHSAGRTTPIEAIRTSTGEIINSFDFGAVDVHGLVWLGGYLWVLDNSNDVVYQVTCAGDVREVFTLPPSNWLSLTFDGTHFWSNNSGMFVQFDLPLPPTAGDFDGDGVVDQNDLAAFELCIDRPVSPECTQGDFDRDCDVDCYDWDQFTLAWGGEGEVRELPSCARAIPTVSEWGMIATVLLLFSAATLMMNYRKATGDGPC